MVSVGTQKRYYKVTGLKSIYYEYQFLIILIWSKLYQMSIIKVYIFLTNWHETYCFPEMVLGQVTWLFAQGSNLHLVFGQDASQKFGVHNSKDKKIIYHKQN